MFFTEGEKNNDNFNSIEKKIRQDLIDFKTRDIITEETRNIRDLIIAKAFSKIDDFDSQPPGEISDPVGFDPSS